ESRLGFIAWSSAAVPRDDGVTDEDRGELTRGEERPERERLVAVADARGDQDDPDDRAVDEPEKEAEQHLSPPEPAERQAEHERELHGAESHAARRDHVEHEEDRER